MIDAVMSVRHPMHGIGQVQRAAVSRALFMPRLDVEVTQDLVKAHIIRCSGHERLLVQLYLFDIRRAIDHPSKGAVAQGQGFQPFTGRPFIPEPVI